MVMKFGLFYELSVPRPWTRESERTVYENALEQVRLADELGFDQVAVASTAQAADARSGSAGASRPSRVRCR
jgi:hypothetical protein